MTRQVLCCIAFLLLSRSEALYDCVWGQTVDVTVGNSPVILSSPTNSENLAITCDWSIKAADPSKHVKLVTLRSDMQSTFDSCLTNYVLVKQGTTVLQRWCDDSTPTVISSNRTLSLEYNTINRLLNTFAVQLTQTSEVSTSCVQGSFVKVIARDTPVYLTSPNYPHDYDSYSDCFWQITAVNSSQRVELKTLDMELEGSDCQYDFLEARDGKSDLGTLLEKWCGTQYVTVYSSDDDLYLHFHSDGSSQYRGFRLQVRQVSGPPPDVSMIVGITLGSFFILSGFGIVCVVHICHQRSRRN